MFEIFDIVSLLKLNLYEVEVRNEKYIQTFIHSYLSNQCKPHLINALRITNIMTVIKVQ